ncbi:hypothetical protein PILCRDRAFT_300520 [Piloderma croceum F 1598]|uniref:DUF4211 domain-containing protein n=1 Tax=Piloderma croceum (strain F 1598) TaxID=765440 RepID=A0A0C3BL18_PILCF|nr:hypothetical protein PILCRDRAFT_300520 [Piloderma croceum F 1598]
MPRKAGSSSPSKLKQKTLVGFLSSSPAAVPTPQTPKRANKPKVRKRGRVVSPESESDVDLHKNGTGSDGSDVGAVHFEPEDLSDENESPRRPTAMRRTPRVRAESSNSDEENKSAAPSVEPSKNKTRRKSSRFGKRKQVEEDSESEDELQPKKRKFVKGVRPSSPEDDEEDILDEVDEHRIIEPRLRTRDKKTVFQKNLERLTRKKRGLAPSESSESANEDEEEDEDNSPVTPFAGARPDTSDDASSSRDQSLQEPEDDSFIVEDDGAPTAELPMEYSMNTHQDLAHHFKIICQFFVHLAVRPAAERRSFVVDSMKNEQYFSVPLHIARRKLSGLRDSLVASSVWRPDFKQQLEKYPIFELTGLDFAVPACDACHLGGRMSTLLGRVSGSPYDRFGFEPLVAAESSDSEDSDEEKDLAQEFNLGRFCAKRTQVFHRFTHWEYSLYQTLSREVEELRSSGARGFVRVAFAKGLKPPKDLTDADGIMEWLDQRGIIDMEWQIVRELMESARNLEVAARRGEDDID